jgi:hypothetical protein
MLRSNSACKLEGLTLDQLCTQGVSWQLSCIVGFDEGSSRALAFWLVLCEDRDSNPKCNHTHNFFFFVFFFSCTEDIEGTWSKSRERTIEECGRWGAGPRSLGSRGGRRQVGQEEKREGITRERERELRKKEKRERYLWSKESSEEIPVKVFLLIHFNPFTFAPSKLRPLPFRIASGRREGEAQIEFFLSPNFQ